MTSRNEWSGVWTQVWDVDNRVKTMTNTTTGQAVTFVYDGDGKRVKRIDSNITTTLFIGNLYEKNVTTGITRTYYFAGSQRVAMRQGGVLYFL